MTGLRAAVLAGLRDMLTSVGTAAPVYVAGPYAGESDEIVAENVRRAVEIGHLCLTVFTDAPVLVPHALGRSGLYGAPEDDGGASASREAALQQGQSWAALAGRLGGVLVIILREDGTFSTGTAAETETFRRAGGDRIIRGTYAQLKMAFSREYHWREGAVAILPDPPDVDIHEDVCRVWPPE